ncbi:NAD(P)-dependent oxidoreductase [Lachnospiraceae bacterium 62-35]
MNKIGFIGIGIMGKSMARNLMKSGYEVAVYTRTKEKAEELLAEGAKWCDSVKECAAGRDLVITIIGTPKDVEEVYLGENGILENADRGTYLADMTTTSPKLAVRLYEEGKKRGLYVLDAPVTGGDKGAKDGTLTILAGGDKEVFAACLPVFEKMGRTIIYEGKAGSGQHTKMCNQIAVAGTLAGIAEAMVYAERVGLDTALMIDTISTGAAGSVQMNLQAPKILAGDYGPGFFIKHFVKDMGLADEEGKAAGVKLQVLETVLEMYQKLQDQGMGEEGMQALVKYYS